ncbi:MAG: response regulator transcription factor [Bacteroidetes bacterium]|nr:response regulator transcription factor [Bacteroidota bacterium]
MATPTESRIKALIVDDEPKLAEVLALKITDHLPQVELVGRAANVEEAYKLIKEQKPDVVFLDISMPGGSGFNLLDRFEEPDFKTIFVTGHSEYAIDAFRVSAVDYLLKPVRTRELVEAVEKYEQQSSEAFQDLNLLKHNLDHSGNQESKIAIPGAQAYEFVFIREIIRLEGIQKYTQFYLSDGRKILSSYNIGTFKPMLESFGFFCPHKSHLINIRHIKRYLTEGTIRMEDDSAVPVSRRKREEFITEVLKNGSR